MSKLSADEVRPHVVADALRRHPVLIIGVAIVVAVLVGLLAQGQAASYTSSAKVLIRPTLGNPFAPDTGSSGQQVTIAMQTESQVVDSSPVATIANKKLQPDWVAGSSTVSAVVPPNTQVVQISFTAPSAKAAQTGAQTVAESYLDYRSAQTTSTQKARLDILTKQADTVRASLQTASKAAAAANAAPEAAQQVQLYANQLVSIQNSISTLESGGTDPGNLIAPATLPDKPGGISPLLLAIGGGLVGLAGGLILAIWRERRDKRLRATTDLSVGTVPVLANLVASPSRFAGLSHRSRAASQRPAGEDARAFFQRLRTVTLATSRAPATLAVSAVTSGAPSSQVSLNLARSLMRAGYTVTLVSAETSGRIERALDITASTGLAEALSSKTGTQPELVEVDGLRVLPAGALAEVEALLFSERFSTLLTQLKAGADYVVISSPPAATPAGMGLGVATDAMMLVGIDRVTTADDVEGVAVRASRLGVDIMGLVATPRAHRSLGGRRGEDAALSTEAGADPYGHDVSGPESAMTSDPHHDDVDPAASSTAASGVESGHTDSADEPAREDQASAGLPTSVDTPAAR
ncbi:MAG: hypothetical protein L0H96_15650 [Humibacillus sp.]|nr:hypothetical protein [Humibacillus sp.]MDN5778334.1 hypothetical protein [Humibacillus sp.]